MIFDKARELNEALSQSEEYLRLARARDAMEHPRANALLGEYQARQSALIDLLSQEGPDREELISANDDMERAQQALLDTPVFVALTQAQTAFEALLARVNGLVTDGLLGSGNAGCRPGGCAGCGGCPQ